MALNYDQLTHKIAQESLPVGISDMPNVTAKETVENLLEETSGLFGPDVKLLKYQLVSQALTTQYLAWSGNLPPKLNNTKHTIEVVEKCVTYYQSCLSYLGYLYDTEVERINKNRAYHRRILLRR